MERGNPEGDGRGLGFNHKKKGMQHGGRLTGFGVQHRILIHHDAIYGREIQLPETQEGLSNGCRLGSPTDPISLHPVIQGTSVVEMCFDYGFHSLRHPIKKCRCDRQATYLS